MINGHRVAPYRSGTNFGADTFVDLNGIPRAAIESVEILKAALQRFTGWTQSRGREHQTAADYNGAEVNVEYGNTTDRDSGERHLARFWRRKRKDQITGTANYYSRNSIYSHDRAYN